MTSLLNFSISDAYKNTYPGLAFGLALITECQNPLNPEMCAGILVAVTDYDRFKGALLLDLAGEGEICRGLGRREFLLKDREIVLRDEEDVVCVLCQGADEKTRVSENTRRVLFYAYAVPGVDAESIQEGLVLAAETMTLFGGGTTEGVEVF